MKYFLTFIRGMSLAIAIIDIPMDGVRRFVGCICLGIFLATLINEEKQ